MRFNFRHSSPVLLSAVALVALVSFGFSKVIQVREDAIRSNRANHLKQITLAIRNYSDANDSLPSPTLFDTTDENPGLALNSWRYRIAPFLASYKMDIHADLSWDHSNNSKWLTIPQPFSVGGWSERRSPLTRPTETNVYAITGAKTAFGDGKTNLPMRLDAIPHDTILIAEIANSGHHWMQPGDFDISTMSHEINIDNGKSISGTCKGGFHIAFLDCEVWFMSNSTPYDALEKFFTIEGSSKHDRNIVLAKYRLK